MAGRAGAERKVLSGGGQTSKAEAKQHKRKQHKSDDAAPPTRPPHQHTRTHLLLATFTIPHWTEVARPTPFAFSKRYICFTMLRSLVAAFVAIAASTSAFTISPIASHRNCAASHAGSSAPLSMAESDADKIRCVAVLFAVNRELHVWPTPVLYSCAHWAHIVCTLLRSPPLIYLAMNTILICFILFSHQNINSVVTLELLLTSIMAKPPSLMP